MTMKVSELKTIVFTALNLQDKVNIKNVRRPTPAIMVYGLRARQHLGSLAPVMNDE